jgi:hypothetical protein
MFYRRTSTCGFLELGKIKDEFPYLSNAFIDGARMSRFSGNYADEMTDVVKPKRKKRIQEVLNPFIQLTINCSKNLV